MKLYEYYLLTENLPTIIADIKRRLPQGNQADLAVITNASTVILPGALPTKTNPKNAFPILNIPDLGYKDSKATSIYQRCVVDSRAGTVSFKTLVPFDRLQEDEKNIVEQLEQLRIRSYFNQGSGLGKTVVG